MNNHIINLNNFKSFRKLKMVAEESSGFVIDLSENKKRKKVVGKKTYNRSSAFCRYVSLSLVFLMLLGPVFRAYAEEGETATSTSSVLLVEGVVEDTGDTGGAVEEVYENEENNGELLGPFEVIKETVKDVFDVLLGEEVVYVTANPIVVEIATTTEQIMGSVIVEEETTETTATTTETTATTTEEETTETTATTTETTATTTEEEIIEGATEEGVTDEEEITETTATTTETTATTTEEEITTRVSASMILLDEGNEIAQNLFFNDENKYIFSDKECTLVRDGEFFCVRSNEDLSTVTQVSSQDKPRVFVRQDNDGDKEIFFEQNGEEIQITNNLYDDDEPFYDGVGNSIVWHSLIEDRYQIMVYENETGQTNQITKTTFNNINPRIFGNVLVWQGWVGNSWEIFVAELVLNSGSEIIQLTDNNYNDMFPKIHEHLITWQAFTGDSWKVFVHDLNTEQTSLIGEGDGNFESPRFVVLMENRKGNGDIEKIGYEISSGEKIQLGVTPKTFPEPLPIIPTDPLENQDGVLPPVVSFTSSTTILRNDSSDDENEE